MFEAAETKIAEIDSRVTVLEAGMDLSAITTRLDALEAENAVLRQRTLDLGAQVITLSEQVAKHEDRLDAVSLGAQG